MQHPTPFSTPAPPQEGFLPQGLESTTGLGGPTTFTGTDPVPAASVNLLYQPPNLERDVFPVPPAGFQMAPCGCFFDPRIYRIEQAAADFGQPLYELVLARNPTSPSSYLLEPQHYTKGPAPPIPPLYPCYQSGAPSYLVPYIPPKGPSQEVLGFMGAGGAPGFVELPPQLLKEGWVPVPPPKDSKLPPLLLTLPAEAPLPPSACSHIQGHRGQVPGPQGAGQPAESWAVSTKEPQGGSGAALGLCQPLVPSGVRAQEAAPAGGGEAQVCEGVRTSSLPDRVLLEDAMKLFDCLPGRAEPNTMVRKAPGPGLLDGGGGGDDSARDIRSLHLPEELLSFDYNVPEILDTMSNTDGLFSFQALEEEPPPCYGAPRADLAVPVPQADTRRGKKRATCSARKGKAGATSKQAAGARRDLGAAPH